jgi:hypothetical protein
MQYLSTFLVGLKKATKALSQIIYVLTEIRTWNLPNIASSSSFGLL